MNDSFDEDDRAQRTFHRRTEPGAAPGTLVDDPKRGRPTIHVFEYNEHGLKETDIEDVREIPAMLSPDQIVWIDIEGIGDAGLIRQMGEMFKLHPLALEDVVHVHQRAKVEEFVDHMYVVTRMYSPAEDLQFEQVSMFIGQGWLLTFQDRPGDCFGAVRDRLRKDRGNIRKSGADYLAYCLIDATIDDYFPLLEAYGEKLDSIEETLAARWDSATMRKLHHARRDLLTLRRVLWPHRDMISALLRGQHSLIASQTLLYLRDCYDHTIQLIDVAETFRETCTDLRELYLSEINQQTSEITKVLTFIATLFLPISFIAGMYGMNFDPAASPWNMPELKWFLGYPFALGLMFFTEIGFLWYFWRRGWFGR